MTQETGTIQAKARARFVRISPTKARPVIDLIRGKPAEEALSILAFTPRKAARITEKVLRSAIANFFEKEGASDYSAKDLMVSRAFVDQGPTMKRYRARAMGRANLIRKRTSHITVEVRPAAAKTRRK